MIAVLNIFNPLLQWLAFAIVAYTSEIDTVGEYALVLSIVSPILICITPPIKNIYFARSYISNKLIKAQRYIRYLIMFILSIFSFGVHLVNCDLLAYVLLVKVIEIPIDSSITYKSVQRQVLGIIVSSVLFFFLYLMWTDKSEFVYLLSFLVSTIYLTQEGKVGYIYVLSSYRESFPIIKSTLVIAMSTLIQRLIVKSVYGVGILGVYTICTQFLVVASILTQTIVYQFKVHHSLRKFLTVVFVSTFCLPLFYIYFNEIIMLVFNKVLPENYSLFIFICSMLIYIDFVIFIKLINLKFKHLYLSPTIGLLSFGLLYFNLIDSFVYMLLLYYAIRCFINISFYLNFFGLKKYKSSI
jgi:hypothetical protein